MPFDQRGECLTDNVLIDQLARKVLHWSVGPDRFLTGNRSWLPKWRFNPLERIEDSFLLLDHSKPARYVVSQTGGKCRVVVEHDGKIGRAADDSKPRAITLALARSLGMEV
jgi:hypothetical protein